MPSAIVLVLYVLAVARITTLITHDEITAPTRRALIRRFDPDRRLHRLVVYLLGSPDDDAIGCPWCVSVWVGLLSSPVIWFWPGSPLIMVLIGLAASQITGMIYGYGRR